MKKLKLVVWMIIIVLLQTVAAHYIRIFDVVPIFILPFLTGIMLMEDDFAYASAVGIIGGICAGAFTGKNFFLSAVLIILISLVVFALRDKPKYTHTLIKMIVWTAVVSFIWETLSYVLLYHTLEGFKAAVSYAAMSAVYNSVISCIIYPCIKRTLYVKEEKRRIDRRYVKR